MLKITVEHALSVFFLSREHQTKWQNTPIYDAIEVTGSFPENKLSNRYLLVILDYLSK